MTGESFLNNFDMALFYEKRVRDFVDSQRPNGGFTETAPFVGIADQGLGGGSGPIEWQTFLPVACMWLYKYHGNERISAESYTAATAYVQFLDNADSSLIENGLGDWMALETKALALTGLGFQLISYLEYANMSTIVGNLDVAESYSIKAAAVASLINDRYLDVSSGAYGDSAGGWNATQCGQAMPLWLNIVPLEVRRKAAAVLAANVEGADGHLAVGAFGVKYLLMALADNDEPDLALGILTQPDYPGFGFMLNAELNNLTNATSIWEAWFPSDDVYSNNHAMFTSNEAYQYQSLAGIMPHPQARAFDRIIFKPSPPRNGGLDWVNASIVTMRGRVSSSWSITDSEFRIILCVPPNTDAELWMPNGKVYELGSCCGCTFTSAT